MVFRHGVANEAIPALQAITPRTRIVLETVDLHHLREQRQAELSGDAAKLAAARESKRSELAAIQASDAAIVLSEFELDYVVQQLPQARLYHIPIAREAPPLPATGFENRRHILFIGGFRHPPNVDGLLWFCREVWPQLRASGFSDRLIVVGGDAPAEVNALDGPDIEVLGQVADISEVFSSARLSIAPLRYGAGLKGKVITSLSYGLPGVTTAMGAEGAKFVSGEHLLVGSTAEEFAVAVLQAYQDADVWRRLAQGGRQFFDDNFSVAQFEARLRALLGDLGLV